MPLLILADGGDRPQFDTLSFLQIIRELETNSIVFQIINFTVWRSPAPVNLIIEKLYEPIDSSGVVCLPCDPLLVFSDHGL